MSIEAFEENETTKRSFVWSFEYMQAQLWSSGNILFDIRPKCEFVGGNKDERVIAAHIQSEDEIRSWLQQSRQHSKTLKFWRYFIVLKFNQVLSLTSDPDTGKAIATHCDIVTVRLSSETYDRSPSGYNLYEVDINSVDCELDKEIYEVTIAAGNVGDWVRIQRGLNPETSYETEPEIFKCKMEDALIKGNLLIVTNIKKAMNV